MSSRRDRARRPARRSVLLEPRRRLLIVCEGEVTEPAYFKGFIEHCKNPLVKVVDLQIEPAAGVPFTLVQKAKELKEQADALARRERDENLRYDEVWCVFDLDEHPRVAEARQCAVDNGLRLAMSNPCFELWLLLHFRDSPGAQHRHHVQKLLAKATPNVRAKHIDFSAVIGGYEQAFKRAERLEEDAQKAGEATRNPTTAAFHLTNSIDEVGRNRRRDEEAARADRGRALAEQAARDAHEQAARELAESDADQASCALPDECSSP